MTTLNPYSGSWDSKKASFLLGRTTFGKTRAQIAAATANGLEETIETLFSPVPTPEPPIYYKFDKDPQVPIGSSWVGKYQPDNSIIGLRNARKRSVIVWQTGIMQESGMSILEKMVLFWHEHFPVNDINLGEVSFQYLSTIRSNALGNFRALVEEMTISPAMLIFLNGNQNVAASPNENYARELLELFTIGRGDAVGEGDYTNYTEKDIVEIARALTGWKARVNEDGYAESFYLSNKHDKAVKQLSYRFDEVIINNGGESEYKQVIDIILGKIEVARHICRQLHIWFVGADIDADIEANIIGPMADLMYDNNYDITIPVKALLQSEYFFDEKFIGCMISSPLDFLYKSVNTFEIALPENLVDKYFVWEAIATAGGLLEMAVMHVPSVAGWKAYYQKPSYYKFWINSVTLGFREEVAIALIVGDNIRGFKFGINVLNFIASVENATDPNELITNIAALIYEFPLSENQLEYLKGVLIPGLPDFEWTVEYGKYLEDPENPNTATSVHIKAASLLATMMKMPEFYLM